MAEVGVVAAVLLPVYVQELFTLKTSIGVY